MMMLMSVALANSTLSGPMILTAVCAVIAALGAIWLVLGLPPLTALGLNWKIRYSISTFDIQRNEKRRHTKRWRVQPGIHTVLLRIMSPREDGGKRTDLTLVDRSICRFWDWRDADENCVRILNWANARPFEETRQQSGLDVAVRQANGHRHVGSMEVGESKWVYVTIEAIKPWEGRLSFRAPLEGKRRAARLSFAVSGGDAAWSKKFILRWISHGPVRPNIHPHVAPLPKPASQSGTDSNEA